MTEYFISMDDDFVVTADTKLEDLLEVIDESGYDLIGGEVLRDLRPEAKGVPSKTVWDKFGHFDLTRSAEGFCYFRGKLEIQSLPGFPKCVVRDISKNYFIGRISTVSTVRMDPHFARTGHKEFFLDALGELRIAR